MKSLWKWIKLKIWLWRIKRSIWKELKDGTPPAPGEFYMDLGDVGTKAMRDEVDK